MLVVKFGGSILNNAHGLRTACNEARRLPRPLLLVVSAFADVTNRLERIAATALGEKERAGEMVVELFEDHHAVARETLSDEALIQWEEQADEWRRRLEQIIEGLSIVGELSPRTLDLIVHFGERLSSSLVGGVLGAPVVSATELLITDENHRFARADLRLSGERIRERLSPLLHADLNSADVKREENEEEGKNERGVSEFGAEGLIVTEGYIARGRHGEITTMGRESSDFSATLFGELLGASEVRIYTGVPGIMTADPALVPGARTIPQMSYGMAQEIALLGAKVIHPRTVRPVERAGIPLVFNDMNGARTVIGSEGESDTFSITLLSDASLLTFRIARTDADVTGLLERIAGTVPVIRFTRSGRTLHVLTPVPVSDPGRPVREEGGEGLVVEYRTTPTALVACVREGGITAEDALRFISALSRESIHSVWSDSGERSICALVHPDRSGDIVGALHRQFPVGS